MILRLSRTRTSPVAACLLLVATVAGCGSASSSPSQIGAGAGATPGPSAPRATSAGRSARLVSTLAPFRLPHPLSRMALFSADGSIIVAGGLSDAGTSGSVVRIAPGDGTATPVGTLAAPTHDAAGASIGGQLLVIGGGRTVAAQSVQSVDSQGRSASLGSLPGARADLGAATIGSEAIIAGGWTGSSLDARVLATADGATFRIVATLPVPVRYPAVAALGGLLYVIGGTGASGDVATVQVIDPATGAVRVAGTLPYPLSHASAFVLDGRLLVAGGRRGSVASDAILEITPAPFAVDQVGSLPSGRSDASAIVIGSTAYVVGGEADTYLDSIVELSFG